MHHLSLFFIRSNHWPNVFNNESYIVPSRPSIPLQLSLLVKNVSLHLDFIEFCSDVKTCYPEVKKLLAQSLWD
jgi:hypothetical protein